MNDVGAGTAVEIVVAAVALEVVVSRAAVEPVVGPIVGVVGLAQLKADVVDGRADIVLVAEGLEGQLAGAIAGVPLHLEGILLHLAVRRVDGREQLTVPIDVEAVVLGTIAGLAGAEGQDVAGLRPGDLVNRL